MRKQSLFFFFILLIITTCPDFIFAQANAFDTTVFRPAKKLTQLKSKKLAEISGIAASYRHKGLYWVINDSGNTSEVFLIDSLLNIVATCSLQNVLNRDWEDIVVGPGPDPSKSYVYVADIGDNFGFFPVKVLYCFEEPARPAGNSTISLGVKDIRRIAFRLPEGPKDSEAILFDHQTKNIYLLTKFEKPTGIYELKYPYFTGDTLMTSKVAAFAMPSIVSGSVSRDGKHVLLKNYKRIYYWDNSKLEPLASVFAREPSIIPNADEAQGESMTWTITGNGFFTISETTQNFPTFLYYYQRKKR
jgi:hypothetical protein